MDKTKNDGEPPNAFVEAVRQITTPITAIGLIVVVLPFIVSAIAKCELESSWKGGLLAAVLTLLSGTVGAFFYMAIRMPKNLTFDKEAHLAVSVNVNPEEVVRIVGLAQALAQHGKDSDYVEKLAVEMARQKPERPIEHGATTAGHEPNG